MAITLDMALTCLVSMTELAPLLHKRARSARMVKASSHIVEHRVTLAGTAAVVGKFGQPTGPGVNQSQSTYGAAGTLLPGLLHALPSKTSEPLLPTIFISCQRPICRNLPAAPFTDTGPPNWAATLAQP